MSFHEDQVHSTLEAVSQKERNLRNKPLPINPGIQLVPIEGIQLASDPTGIEPTIGAETVINDGHGALAPGSGLQAKITRPWKWRWIPLALIIFILASVLAGVLGGVLGSRHNRSHSAPEPHPSNFSATSPSTPPSQRKIAAFSYAENSNINTHVYFQDNTGQIIEGSNSVYNATLNIKKTGVSGKNGSAIAAAVSRPNFPLEFHIFYLDVNNQIHDAISNTSTDSWSPGSLSAQAYTAMPNSSLTAIYNQCRLCANTTLIAFQDMSGFVQVGNLTSKGWTLEQLDSALDPAIGTGLAMQPFYREGLEDQINLYHQKRTLTMSLASWKPAPVNNGVDGWSLAEQIYSTIPLGSPIAAASSFSNVSTGYETWIEVLFLYSQGIQVSTWSGAIDSWLQQNIQPSAMANSTNNQKVYGDVAVTAAGRAFGVIMVEGQVDAIESYSVENDLVNWNSNGTVNLGGSWG